MSEALFQALPTKDPKIQILPTVEIVCSGAWRRQEQMVKYQIIVQLKFGTGSYDVVFLVVPGLGPQNCIRGGINGVVAGKFGSRQF